MSKCGNEICQKQHAMVHTAGALQEILVIFLRQRLLDWVLISSVGMI